MSSVVRVPFGDDPRQTAILLLAAAEEMDGYSQSENVRTTSEGEFLAPQDLAEKAGVSFLSEDEDGEPAVVKAKRAPRKTAAKKTAPAPEPKVEGVPADPSSEK